MKQEDITRIVTGLHRDFRRGPMSERKRRKPNPYWLIFKTAYDARPGALPYGYFPQDFVHLTRLMNALGEVGEELSLSKWLVGVEHYFQSERGRRSMADLCLRFGDFYLHPLDRFSQPLRGNGGYMRHITDVTALPWPIGFLRRVNAVDSRYPEKRDALMMLLDQVEAEDLDEAEALKRLEAIERAIDGSA